jgi:hypothetical protein
MKQKKGRPRSENPMVHTAIVLPQDLLEKLKADAAAMGHGLSTEIRQQLVGRRDPETNNLLNAMDELAGHVARKVGMKWHQNAYAFAAYKAGVDELFARYHPEGDAKAPPNRQGPGPGNADPPNIVGRVLSGLTGTFNPSRADHDKKPSKKE